MDRTSRYASKQCLLGNCNSNKLSAVVRGVARFGIVEGHVERGIIVFNPVFPAPLNQKLASLTSSNLARLVFPTRQHVMGLASGET